MDDADDIKESPALQAETAEPRSIGIPVDDRELADLPLNDVGNAKRLQARFGLNLCHTAKAGWYVWDGRRWQQSVGRRGGPGATVMRYAQETAAAIAAEADAIAADTVSGEEADKRRRDAIAERARKHRVFGLRSGNDSRLGAMLTQVQPHLDRDVQEFDQRLTLFNAANGTIDLRSKDLQPGEFDRGDLLTRISPVTHDPDAEAPTWRHFLKYIQPNVEIRTFLQCWAGYCLSGLTDEQRLILAYGTGANGKSVLFGVLAHVLGDYALTAAIQTFLRDDRRGGADATPDLARLVGARGVVAAEPEGNAALNENLIKLSTGGDKIVARQLFERVFEFQPQFKLMLLANVRPRILGQDRGIWRRILLVPFEVTIGEQERDPKLLQKIIATEASGVLNWMIDGWRLYRDTGLVIPDAIRDATAQYRSESDSVYDFMTTCTIRVEGARIRGGKLYEAYRAWCASGTTEPVSMKKFGLRLVNLDYAKVRAGGGIVYLDLALVEGAIPDPSDQEGPGQ